ncbi:FAD dependent oxidoreductase [Microbacterium sp. SLBN-154]|uniref:FAD-dependent oxidoreductase n=1 Tax=Microbacterium sp. SLBN-154 TaxID=2768458 RepID=UPI001172FF2D|nr:FAD-dependent oxidoreductase [Microbacterium sp. SLBN-154]TQK17694.1 FAD dependent oxidoreductase [Microbacterium sp. SLBN-154]
MAKLPPEMISRTYRPDVLVVGAGCAGIAASVAAAEMGASVLVVESSGFAGGFITAVMGPGLDGMFDTVTGEVVLGGIAQDIMEDVQGVSRARQREGRFRHGGDLTAESGADSHKVVDETSLEPVDLDLEHFKVYADARLEQAGAEVLYHSRAAGLHSSDEVIESVIVANKSGLSEVRPTFIVDCSGDADIAAWAGNPYDSDPERAQPMTLHFRMGNVSIGPDLVAHCSDVLRDAHAAGMIPPYGGPYMLKLGEGDVLINATRLRADRTDAEDWSRAEVESRKQAWTMFKLFKERVPECVDAYYISSGPETGARETRRIRGEYQLTVDDVRSQRRFDDAIVLGAWYLDRHRAESAGFHEHPQTRPYDIPFRTLIPLKSKNLLVAGRCHSATQEALASSRVTGTAMGMGEAAGVAAAIAVASNISAAKNIPAADVRAELRRRGAILH